jgi:hypothetical protein
MKYGGKSIFLYQIYSLILFWKELAINYIIFNLMVELHTSVEQFFEFLNNHQFQLFKYCRIAGSASLKKIQKSKSWWSWLFQRPQRTIGFHERTSKEPAILWLLEKI